MLLYQGYLFGKPVPLEEFDVLSCASNSVPHRLGTFHVPCEVIACFYS